MTSLDIKFNEYDVQKIVYPHEIYYIMFII